MRAATIACLLPFLAPGTLAAQRLPVSTSSRHGPATELVVYAPPPIPAYGHAVVMRYPHRTAACVNTVGVVHSHHGDGWWQRSGFHEVRIWYNTSRREFCAEARGDYSGLRAVRAYERGGFYVIPERDD